MQTRTQMNVQYIGLVLAIQVTLSALALAGSISEVGQLSSSSLAALDSPSLRVVSDEDQANMQNIKYQISNDYSDFKTIDEVHIFLEKVRLLVQKHPKNTAFAQGDLKELLKFLSQEVVAKLIRVDNEPFITPISDEKIPLAQRAVDDDELTRKLFGGPLRSFIEAKRQLLSRGDDSNHRDGNFFTNIWCKISGGCPNQ